MRSAQEGDEPDNSGADWRKYLKLEVDDELVDGPGAADLGASVIRRDAAGHWLHAATEERRSADETGRSENQQGSDTGTIPGSGSMSSRDSSGAAWATSSALREETERQHDIKTWLVSCNCSQRAFVSVTQLLC